MVVDKGPFLWSAKKMTVTLDHVSAFFIAAVLDDSWYFLGCDTAPSEKLSTSPLPLFGQILSLAQSIPSSTEQCRLYSKDDLYYATVPS